MSLRKSAVTVQNAELEALQARLKAMEVEIEAKKAGVSVNEIASAGSPASPPRFQAPNARPTQPSTVRSFAAKPGLGKPPVTALDSDDDEEEEESESENEEEEEDSEEEEEDDDSSEEGEDTESDSTTSDNDRKQQHRR